MSKYTLTIEGNFEKGDCYSCPLSLIEYELFRDDDPHCMAGEESSNCPLEEVKQGRWIFRKVIKSEETGLYGFECSECGNVIYLPDKTKINNVDTCHICKAEMKGGA